MHHILSGDVVSFDGSVKRAQSKASISALGRGVTVAHSRFPLDVWVDFGGKDSGHPGLYGSDLSILAKVDICTEKISTMPEAK
jgi:hypothetical protein